MSNTKTHKQTIKASIYDEVYDIEIEYDPKKVKINLLSIDNKPPLRYTFHTIKTLETEALKQLK